MQLDKITQGLKQEITKVEPLPMDNNAIRKLIAERNTPIVVATPYAMMKFGRNRTRNRKEEEKDQKPAE